eukprot:371163-Amphidinium_carterae.1
MSPRTSWQNKNSLSQRSNRAATYEEHWKDGDLGDCFVCGSSRMGSLSTFLMVISLLLTTL